MTLRDEDYKRIVPRAMEAFRHLPNVHSVGIGGRERAGKPTGEIVLKVFVRKKSAREALSLDAVIPSEFEGVPTDVVEAPEPNLSAAPGGKVLGGPYDKDERRYRPLRGGIQVSGAAGAGFGTLGIICRVDEPPPTRIVAMTCHHVLFASAAAEVAALKVGQPTSEDSVTKCCRGVFGTFLKGYRDNTMDAAAVLFEKDTEYYPQIEEIGVVNSDHAITVAEAATLTYPVRKRGRTTRLTGGTIQAIGAVHGSGISGYMVIKPNPEPGGGTATFADHGDSGSGVVNDTIEVVGLLFAMSSLTPGDTEAGWGFAWGIGELKARFAADGLDLICDSGTTLNEKRVAQVGAIAEIADSAAPVVARKIEADLSDSQLGRALTGFWLRHSTELNRLVNRNRRVTTRWHRSGGPALFQCGLRSVYNPATPIPEVIEGRPTDECLRAVLDLFDQYGSQSLRDDIRAYRALLPSVSGRSYVDLLAALRGQPKVDATWPD